MYATTDSVAESIWNEASLALILFWGLLLPLTFVALRPQSQIH